MHPLAARAIADGQAPPDAEFPIDADEAAEQPGGQGPAEAGELVGENRADRGVERAGHEPEFSLAVGAVDVVVHAQHAARELRR